MTNRWVLFPTGGLYSGNKQIGFNSVGENYQSQFTLASILRLGMFAAAKKRGRPKGPKDSYKRIRRF